MKLATPRIDGAALRKGLWGNSWRNWGLIALAFTALYAFEAGYFAGLLIAAREIRGSDYKVLTSSYFGPFETTAAPAPPSPALPPGRAFNAPDGCVEETRPVPVPGAPGVTVDVPTGVQKCDPKKNEGWAIFPWVAATSGAGAFPGCAAAGGATVLGAGSPLYTGSAGAAARAAAGVDAGAAACQNFVPSAREAAAGGAGADAPAPAPAPGR